MPTSTTDPYNSFIGTLSHPTCEQYLGKRIIEKAMHDLLNRKPRISMMACADIEQGGLTLAYDLLGLTPEQESYAHEHMAALVSRAIDRHGGRT